MNCKLCEEINQIKQQTNPQFVAELQTGYVVMGEHQFFRGYTLLLCKEHKAELHELGRDFKMTFLEEMSLVAEAVFKAFHPNKLNYELLGNTVPHMHWHIFPRYADDPNPKYPVWTIDESICYTDSVKPSPEDLQTLKQDLLRELKKIDPESILSSFE